MNDEDIATKTSGFTEHMAALYDQLALLGGAGK